MNYVGVDPGVSGGLVSISSHRKVISAIKMPKTDREIWTWMCGYHISSIADETNVMAVIEEIPPAIGTKNDKGQGSGKSQMSKLYGSYRALLMALTIANVKILKVKLGEVWRSFSIPPRQKDESRSQWKRRLSTRAQGLFPGEKVTLAISDALLFAEFGRRRGEGLEISKFTPRLSDSGVSL